MDISDDDLDFATTQGIAERPDLFLNILRENGAKPDWQGDYVVCVHPKVLMGRRCRRVHDHLLLVDRVTLIRLYNMPRHKHPCGVDFQRPLGMHQFTLTDEEVDLRMGWIEELKQTGTIVEFDEEREDYDTEGDGGLLA